MARLEETLIVENMISSIIPGVKGCIGAVNQIKYEMIKCNPQLSGEDPGE